MCGIVCALGACDAERIESLKLINQARGPDASGSFQADSRLGTLQLFGYVLFLRGSTSQPVIDGNGNALLFNGQVYDGLLVRIV